MYGLLAHGVDDITPMGEAIFWVVLVLLGIANLYLIICSIQAHRLHNYYKKKNREDYKREFPDHQKKEAQ
jgi:hypothetical protein